MHEKGGGKDVHILSWKPLLMKCETDGTESGDEISGVKLQAIILHGYEIWYPGTTQTEDI
jgi:hypothetical protein